MKERSKVCILAAGKGTRMGESAAHLNKALFQLDGKAIISHIIERFDKDSDFVIALGHLGEQVINYLAIAHTDLTFQFITVNNFDKQGSGPGYSLLCCEEYLNRPFYLVSCDTIWVPNSELTDTSQNWLGVSRVAKEDIENYCNCEIVEGQIKNIKDKERVSPHNHRSFIGLGFIKDNKTFFDGLRIPSEIAGEHQISNGLTTLIHQGKVRAVDFDWTDVGTKEKYTKELEKFENYDFSKKDESLYFVNSKVIKFFKDPSASANRVKRAQSNISVFPEIKFYNHQFYSYNFVKGETLYARNNIKIFGELISFLHSKLWKIQEDTENFKQLCHKFYFEKTYDRLNKYYVKYPSTDKESIINGQVVPSASSILSELEWDMITDGTPVFFHGDLQFDNILFDKDNSNFILIDWRQDFAGDVNVGDKYYDLAKLYGGINLNYDLIKQNMFSYEEDGNQIYFDFAQRNSRQDLLKILRDYVEDQGMDWLKIEILVGLIYLNMSPLHHFPFDKLLYSLGSMILYDAVKKGKDNA